MGLGSHAMFCMFQVCKGSDLRSASGTTVKWTASTAWKRCLNKAFSGCRPPPQLFAHFIFRPGSRVFPPFSILVGEPWSEIGNNSPPTSNMNKLGSSSLDKRRYVYRRNLILSNRVHPLWPENRQESVWHGPCTIGPCSWNFVWMRRLPKWEHAT